MAAKYKPQWVVAPVKKKVEGCTNVIMQHKQRKIKKMKKLRISIGFGNTYEL